MLGRRRFAEELAKLSEEFEPASFGENELFIKLKALKEGFARIPDLGRKPIPLSFIRVHEEDYRCFARNHATPSIEFEDTPDLDGVQQPRVGVHDGTHIYVGKTMRCLVSFIFGQYETTLTYTAAESIGTGKYELFNARISFFDPMSDKWVRRLI